MPTAEFKKEDLIDLVNDECASLEKIEDRITDTGRWSVHYALTFKDKASGKFYATDYRRGATEQQDESPFEFESALVSCHEVRPVERTVIVYEIAPEGADE